MEEFFGFLYGTRVGSNAVIKGVVRYGEKMISDVNDLNLQYSHKVWKHGECFPGFNTAAYGLTCPQFFRDNSCLSYRKGEIKISSRRGHHGLSSCQEKNPGDHYF
jgi:hypothetical protein